MGLFWTLELILGALGGLADRARWNRWNLMESSHPSRLGKLTGCHSRPMTTALHWCRCTEVPAPVKISDGTSIFSRIWAMIPNEAARVVANAPIDTSAKGLKLIFKRGGDVYVLHSIAGVGYRE